MESKQKLIELYQNTSKHSNYQILPKALRNHISSVDITVNSRFEAERMNYFKANVSFEGKRVLDIGGNTGYFSFEAIDAGAKEVVYVEGNKEHALFVNEAKTQLDSPIEVQNNYFDFSDSSIDHNKFDIVLLLNVLHHFGDDYGDPSASVSKAKEKMIESIHFLHGKTDYLILQIGFCWKGDPTKLLFDGGTKSEVIEFVKKGIEGKWTIENIGVATLQDGKTIYTDLTQTNVLRDDSLGEFRNRPIFILKSVDFSKEGEINFLNERVKDYKDVAPYSNIKKDIILNLIRERVSNNHDTIALQLGCSNGYETKQLATVFKKLDVVDGSDVFIEKLKAQNENQNINFIHALFEDLNEVIPDKKYDYIICNYVLEHVVDSILILQKMKYLLKDQGSIFIVVPNANALSRRIALEMNLVKSLTALTENDLAHGHRRAYTKNKLEADIAVSGLLVQSRAGIVFKLLADFQLNKLLESGFLTEKHFTALQKIANQDENLEFSDSFFYELRKI